jgi:Flp pilus assembly pilin Flp
MSNPSDRCITSLVTTFLRDESGQDLIEYALLTAIISLTSILALKAFSGKMGNAYTSWVTKSQAAWEVCPPLPATCP